jgi:hypothetical protein
VADNVQKTPFAGSINDFARAKAQDAIQLTGRSLPCSVVQAQGAIVRVKFEVQSSVFTLPNVTVPLFGPEYIRYPIQKGDKGVVFAADAYLGGMSGLGGGVADLTQRANLSTLVFFPIGNKAWTIVDPNAVTIYGPNGVVFRDTNSASTFTLTPSGMTLKTNNFTLNCGGTQVAVSPAGVVITGNLTVTGTVIGGTDSINLQAHVHSGAGGTGTSGPPVAGS